MSEPADEPYASVRRVITGVNAAGRSVVVKDEPVRREKGALMLWGADKPTVAGDPAMPATVGWWPAPGGVRISLGTRAPEGRPVKGDDGPKAWPDISDAAGFHASSSTDVIVMISGRIWLQLDDGVEVELSAGDVLIQNGARHRWRNKSDEWPLMAVIIVGATLA